MKTLITLFTALILAFTVISCGKKNTAPATPKEQQPKEQQPKEQQHEEHAARVELSAEQYAMAGIELGTVESKNLSSVVKVNGMLDSPPQNVVSVSPRLGGYVRSTILLQGLRVRKGQVLAVLEHQDIVMLQQEFLETRSRLEFAEAEFKRQEALQKENINAAKTFQQSATEYKSLLARLSALRQRLLLIGINPDKLTESSMSAAYSLVSPMDGYVTEVNITLGKFVSPNDVVCRIVNTSHVHIELMVFERDAPKLREGQRVRFTLVNETEERTAKIFLIGREITQERTVRVHVHLDKEDGRLLPNTALQALIELGEQSVNAVPEAAIVSVGGKDYVFISVEEEHSTKEQSEKTPDPKRQQALAQRAFEQIEVRRGTSAGGFTEVILPASFDRASKIVVKGAYSLLSAMQAGEGGDEHGH